MRNEEILDEIIVKRFDDEYHSIIKKLYDDLSDKTLYLVYDAIYDSKTYRDLDITIEKSDDGFTIFNMEIPRIILLDIIQTIIEVKIDLLPIGSVVELDRRYLNEEKVKESILVTIVQKYAIAEDKYFDYGVLIYPFGLSEDENISYISKRMIGDLIHEGYSDNKEKEYNELLKEDVLINNNYRSMGFSMEEDEDEW